MENTVFFVRESHPLVLKMVIFVKFNLSIYQAFPMFFPPLQPDLQLRRWRDGGVPTWAHGGGICSEPSRWPTWRMHRRQRECSMPVAGGVGMGLGVGGWGLGVGVEVNLWEL